MSEEEYTKLLDKALSQLPPKTVKSERFELPNPSSSISGHRTILSNLFEICNLLNRDTTHLLKFLCKELATAGSIDGVTAVFQGKFQNRIFQKLLDRYLKEYVLCTICHQPDTKIIKKGRYYFLICDACGATSSLRII